MNTPTPPAGYKLVKGEDIKDRVPEGALVSEYGKPWSRSMMVGDKLRFPFQHRADYAIPETKPEPVIPEIGPQPPNGYILKHRSEILEELPVESIAWCPVFKKWVKDVFGDVKYHSSDREWYALKNKNHNPVAEMRREVWAKGLIEAEPSGVEAEVCRDIGERQRKGVAKYGTTVAENPLELREWLQHAYEETLDKAIYLKRAIWQLSKENGDGLERAIELLLEEKRKRDGVNKTCPMH